MHCVKPADFRAISINLMQRQAVIVNGSRPHLRAVCIFWIRRKTMRNLFLAALAALSIGAAIVPAAHAASTIANNSVATRLQQTGSYDKQ